MLRPSSKSAAISRHVARSIAFASTFLFAHPAYAIASPHGQPPVYSGISASSTRSPSSKQSPPPPPVCDAKIKLYVEEDYQALSNAELRPAPSPTGSARPTAPGVPVGPSPGGTPAVPESVATLAPAPETLATPLSIDDVPSCELRLYSAPRTPSAINTRVIIGAKGSALLFSYAVSEPSDVRNYIHSNGLDLFNDDNITVVFVDSPKQPVRVSLAATVNASGNCTAATTNIIERFTDQPCTVTKGPTTTVKGTTTWNAILSIPLTVLKQSRMFPRLFFTLSKTHWVPGGTSDDKATQQLQSYPEVPPAYIEIDVDSGFGATKGRYAAVASDLGYIANAPPHRLNLLGYYPIDATAAVGTAFSDNAKPLNTVRDASLKQIFSSDQYTRLACIACGSFENVAPIAYDRTITSSGALGSDLSNLGIDSVPFS